MIQKEEVNFLVQLVESLQEAEAYLKRAYAARDANGLNSAKITILQIQKKISEVLR